MIRISRAKQSTRPPDAEWKPECHVGESKVFDSSAFHTLDCTISILMRLPNWSAKLTRVRQTCILEWFQHRMDTRGPR